MKKDRKPILVVDDNRDILNTFQKLLRLEGFDSVTEENPLRAIEQVRTQNFDIVISDINMPAMDGIILLEKLLLLNPELLVIMITAVGSEELAVKAMKAGAWHYLSKPVNPEEFSLLVERAYSRIELIKENAILKSEREWTKALDSMIGTSSSLQIIRSLLERVAPTDATILITGESGTGKELVAKAAHELSPRADGNFVAINCAAIPESLLESELFGFEKGAFTGANQNKAGKFEQADGGTFFLDEIGEMPLQIQGKILRVLQEGQIQPLGSTTIKKVDVRVIAATNRDLAKEISEGRFREDLYYRINVIDIDVPPLRERICDIPLLAEHFISFFSEKYKRKSSPLEKEIMGKLCSFNWPGNIRQLRNCIERAVILGLHDIDNYNINDKLSENISREPLPIEHLNSKIPTLKEIQILHVQKVMDLVNGNKAKAARILDVDPKTLRVRLKELSKLV
jgi:DNA-binding NtrC family response regulator